MWSAFFSIIVFPGFIFLSVSALFAEFIDRKIYARLQNRVGPPWFQPFADFIKLVAKEDLAPGACNQRMFRMAPLFALATAATAFLYIPLWRNSADFSFSGDILVVLYLLTIPTLAFFIGGWYSTSLYARIGSVRCLTQLFAYEIPLFMAILSAALLADSWSLAQISAFYMGHKLLWLWNLPGFAVSLVALLGKLEKTPFDIPEAETEVVAGAFTEYSGRLFAILRLTLNVEMVAGAALLAAVFLPFGLALQAPIGFLVFILKIIFVIAILSLCRTVVARLRIDQMISFCWRFLVPLAMLQFLINLFLKGVLFI